MDDIIYDVAVVGSGPAGMTAGLYAARAGLKTVVFESLMAGGQLGSTARIDNYPGFPQGIDGFELASAIREQADRFGIDERAEEVVALRRGPSAYAIETATCSYGARSVIVATGAHPRGMGIEGEDALRGHGVSYCATCDGNFFRGKTVIIVGGGNTAAEDALYLSRICEKVIIVYRRGALRSARVYSDAVAQASNIDCLWFSVVRSLESQEGRLIGAVIEDVRTGKASSVEAEGLFVAIGSIPNTDILKGLVPLDGAGYAIADESCATPLPGMFVAGDIRTKGLRQVVTAVADGAVAAEAAASYLAS